MTHNERLWLAKKALRAGAELAADILECGLDGRSMIVCHCTRLAEYASTRCPTAPGAEPTKEPDHAG